MADSVADRIRKARRLAGLTQAQAADIAGIHRGTLGHWERGAGHLPNGANLVRFAHAIGASPDWLMTGEGPARSGAPEVPAVNLSCFAQSDEEERLLDAFRQCSCRERLLFLRRIESRRLRH